MSVTIVDYSNIEEEYEACALLGTGANGRIFKLDNNQVIKVVIGNNSNFVEKEYNIMLNCQNREEIKSVVFPIIEGSYRDGFVCNRLVSYAGYLLSCEGKKIIKTEVSEELQKQVVNCLWILHSNNIIHGDPRLENLLILNNEVKWIDFRESEFITCKINKRRDVKILFESFKERLVTEVDDKIEQYINNPSYDYLYAIFC